MERRKKPVFGLKMSTVKHFVAAGLQLFQLFGHFLFFLSEALKKFFLCVRTELHFKNCSHRLCLPICSNGLYLLTQSKVSSWPRPGFRLFVWCPLQSWNSSHLLSQHQGDKIISAIQYLLKIHEVDNYI